jgi:putative transcriptional regulator
MNRIKEVFEKKSIKQTQLAEKISESFSRTNAYVCNRCQASLKQLFKIAKILQVEPQ